MRQLAPKLLELELPIADTDAEIETLRAHGFDDDDVWDIASISAFFALSNRIANVSSMRPNDEFYAMGR